MNEIMTMREIATTFKVTEMTIYRWRKSGKLKSYKQGYRRVFKREDVERLRNEETQLILDTKPKDWTVIEIKFFEQLDAKLTGRESFQIKYYPLSGREWCQLILDLAEKYNVTIPKWFEKECRIWNIAI